MGFDITLAWSVPANDPATRNRRMADMLLETIPGLSEFSLDPLLIAESLGVPIEEVWSHSNQIELNAPDSLVGARIELWLDRAYVCMPSNPNQGCESALAAIGPLLAMLKSHGLILVDEENVLVEYETQRARVLRVAEITG